MRNLNRRPTADPVAGTVGMIGHTGPPVCEVIAMMHVALWEPEIPPNTGNVARLCAATGSRLHLVGRLGFHLTDRHLKRAGCDYWDAVDLRRHDSWDDFTNEISGSRLIGLSSHAQMNYTRYQFRDGDCLLFGTESKGLSPSIRGNCAALITIPMPAGTTRSINLATAVGIVLYEALRQVHDW